MKFIDIADLNKVKEIVRNYEAIEMLRVNEKNLIEWKDDLFAKIQSIQSSSDPKNNENFYRQIINVIKELNSYISFYENITEKEL